MPRMRLGQRHHVAQDRRRTRRIDIGVGQRLLPPEHHHRAMDRLDPRDRILARRIDRLRAQRPRPFQPLLRQIERDHVAPPVHRPEDHTKANRPAAEDHDLVASLRLRPVDPMQRHRQRLAHRCHFIGYALRDWQQTVAQPRVAHQQFLGKRPLRSAAPDIAGRHHRVDDHALPDRNAGHVRAHEQQLARAFMAQRRPLARRRDTAIFDVAEVTAANAAGLHLDDHILRPRFGPLIGIEPHVIDVMNGEQAHRASPDQKA